MYTRKSNGMDPRLSPEGHQKVHDNTRVGCGTSNTSLLTVIKQVTREACVARYQRLSGGRKHSLYLTTFFKLTVSVVYG